MSGFTPVPRDCDNVRCKAKVFDALEVAAGSGAHRKVVLDVKPKSWVDGGRYRPSTHQPNADELHVVGLRTGGQAFGITTMYRKHADSCAGGTGVKARSKEAA
jgi:hypothetical protein